MSAQEDVPAAGVTIPELDVADSVRRMLEASRKEQGEAAVEPTPAAPAPPAVPPPAVAVPPAAPPAATTTPVRPAAPAPGARDSAHVPLPAGEFTIRGTDDIRALARELEEAKRRHQQR